MDQKNQQGGATRPVILSGGSGTRLWPLSRRDWPKQLLPLTGDNTLLQLTALRAGDPARFGDPIVVAGDRHAEEILVQLGEVGIRPSSIILEPAARNTAPAIALAALRAAPKDVLLVMPSDHMITDGAAFERAVDEAVGLARRGWLVTLGLTPTYPETGYGYIRRGAVLSEAAYEVAEFVEKPALTLAEAYLASGDYLWNGGIFLFTAERFLDELERSSPDILSQVRQAVAACTIRERFVEPEPMAFSRSPAISVDYAVMEKADRIAVVPVEMGWSDLGSWDALHALAPADEHGNRLSGEVVVSDTKGCSIRSAGPLVAAVGVDDLTIIATGDAVLVMPKGRSQEITKIIDQLKARQSAALEAWPAAESPCARVQGS